MDEEPRRESHKIFGRRDIMELARCRNIAGDLQSMWLEGGERFPKGYRAVFGTLTYRADAEWSAGDIRSCLNRFDMWAKRKGFPLLCVWVREWHESGKPHYHYLMLVPKGITPPMPDTAGYWDKGMSNVKWVHLKAIKKVASYLQKYLTKEQPLSADPRLYKGMRSYGAKGLSSTSAKRRRRLYRAPKWLRSYLNEHSDIRRDKSFWIDVARGLWFISPWRFIRWSAVGLVFEHVTMVRGLIDENGDYAPWDGGRWLYSLAKNQARCLAA